jgi:hypothetical protein
MIKSNTSFAPLTMSSARCLFRLPSLGAIGLKGFTLPHLLNRLLTKTIQAACLHFTLFVSTRSYAHMRAFGYACYPNTVATTPHKLAPRSTRCVFIAYFYHKGYRCLDLSTNCLLVSGHVVFDEDNLQPWDEGFEQWWCATSSIVQD